MEAVNGVSGVSKRTQSPWSPRLYLFVAREGLDALRRSAEPIMFPTALKKLQGQAGKQGTEDAKSNAKQVSKRVPIRTEA